VAKSAYSIDPELTAITRVYTNGKLIADDVMPRIPAINKEEFKYNEFSNVDEAFTVPDTKIGRTSDANQVGQSSKLLTDSTEDWGLKDVVPQPDIDNAPAGTNLLGRSTEFLTDLVLLDREIRVANMVLDATNYPATNKLALVGTSKLTSPDCDPIGIFEDALNSCIMRPNKMAIGRMDFSLLSRNPNIVKAINKTLGDKGKVTKQQIMELFELDDLLIGEAWVNNARKGQARDLKRVWDGSILFYSNNPLADTRQGATFAYTVPYKQRVALTKFDSDLGLHGSTVIKVGESVKELIVANDMAFLLTGTR
jgi:hypothetical protein